MILQMAYYGDPVLRKKGEQVEEINDEIRTLVENMVETMAAHNGIGLAAPQVHQSLALFITRVPKKVDEDQWEEGELRVFINPKILSISKEKDTKEEGCLSIPKVYGHVTRPTSVKLKATDLEGNEFEEELFGLDCRCFLHEYDHTNGILYIDRIRGKERKALDPLLNQVKKKYFTP